MRFRKKFEFLSIPTTTEDQIIQTKRLKRHEKHVGALYTNAMKTPINSSHQKSQTFSAYSTPVGIFNNHIQITRL